MGELLNPAQWINSGLGFALLAVVVLMNWKRRNGNGAEQNKHMVRDAESGDVYFRVSLDRQLKDIRDEVQELNEWLARYESAHEQAARDRHHQLVIRFDAYQQAVERRNDRDVA